jgi:hypothetical protein
VQVTSDTSSSTGSLALGETGKWGGLIILGSAPTSAASYSTNYIEGISGKPYGGTNPNDNSGTLQYVRVWHGGAIVGADNEINGVTFGGVGSLTTVDHVEVAYNADDGFEFFGGTVNVKYLSVLFGLDDSFDTDEGYQGKGQYLFTMLGTTGNHGTEMNAHTGVSVDAQPRSHPQFYSMTIIGGGSTGRSGGLMRLRGGTGGKFGNVILTNPTDVGVRIDSCGSQQIVQDLSFLGSNPSIGTVADGATSGYLYFSSNNIIADIPSTGSLFNIDTSSCPANAVGFTAVQTAPLLLGAHNLWNRFDVSATGQATTIPLDPRPVCGGSAFANVEDATTVDSFFDSVSFKVSGYTAACAHTLVHGLTGPT